MDPRREYSTWNAPASQPQHPSYPTQSHLTSNSPSPQHSPTWNASSLNNSLSWQSSNGNTNGNGSSSNNNHYSTATHSSLPPLQHAHSYPIHNHGHGHGAQAQHQYQQPHQLYQPPSSSSSSSSSSNHHNHYAYMQSSSSSSSVAPSTISPTSRPAAISRTTSDPIISSNSPSDTNGSVVIDPETGLVRPKRKQVKNACQSCQKACKKCDSGRPCARCVKYGLQDSCRDSVRKERKKGVKRGPYKRNGKVSKSSEQTAHPRPIETSNQLMSPNLEEDQQEDYRSNSANSMSPNHQSSSLDSSHPSLPLHHHHHHHQQQEDATGSFSPMSAPASVQRFSVNMASASQADRAIYERAAARDYTSGSWNANPSGSSALGLHHHYQSQGHSLSASSSPSLGAHPIPHSSSSSSLMAHAHPLPSQSMTSSAWGNHDRSISMPAVPHSAPLLSPHSLHNRFPSSHSNGYGQSQQQHLHLNQQIQSSNPVLPSLTSSSNSGGGWPSSSLFSASHPSNAGLFTSHQQQQQHNFGNGINLYSSPLNINGSNTTTTTNTGSFFGGHQRLSSEPNFYPSHSSSSSNNNNNLHQQISSSSSNSIPPLSAHSNSSNSTTNSSDSLSPRTPIQILPSVSNSTNSSLQDHPIHTHSHVQALGNEVVPAIGGPKPFVLKLGAGIRSRSNNDKNNSNLDELDVVKGSMDPPQSADNRRFGLA